jgi:capsular polysaccharide biosynthesis protein/Mrp family chromosome partitioning ATPase
VNSVFASEPRSLIRARWGWIVIITLLVMGGAYGAEHAKHHTYTSTARVVLGPQIFADGAEPLPADLATAKEVATSTVVLEPAARTLGVSETALHDGLSVANPANTTVLDFSYSSTDPGEAQRRAEVIAEAFCGYQNAPLAAVTHEIENAAKKGFHSASTLSVETAKIVSAAQLPTKPSGHTIVLDLIVALIVGAGLGLGVALFVDRFTDRLQGSSEVQSRLAKPVLAAIALPRLPLATDPLNTVRRDPRLAAGFRSLRVRLQDAISEMLRDASKVSFPDRSQRADHRDKSEFQGVVLVTSPTRRGRRALPVSVGLAISMASNGKRVALVGADLRSGTIGHLFRIAEKPGLTQVLRGKPFTELECLAKTALPQLEVLPEGRPEPGAEDLFDQTRMSEMFAALHSFGFDAVVVDGLPLLESPESLVLVASASHVLLHVDLASVGREQLRQSSAALAGHEDEFRGAVVTRTRRFGLRRMRKPTEKASSSPELADSAGAEQSGPRSIGEQLESQGLVAQITSKAFPERDDADANGQLWARRS